MDPNRLLDKMRTVIVRIEEAERSGESPAEHDAETLASLTRTMDEWLERGGFPPVAWTKNWGQK